MTQQQAPHAGEYDAFCVRPHATKANRWRVWVFWTMPFGFGQKTLTDDHAFDLLWDDPDKARRNVARKYGSIPEREELLR